MHHILRLPRKLGIWPWLVSIFPKFFFFHFNILFEDNACLILMSSYIVNKKLEKKYINLPNQRIRLYKLKYLYLMVIPSLLLYILYIILLWSYEGFNFGQYNEILWKFSGFYIVILFYILCTQLKINNNVNVYLKYIFFL